MKRIAILGSTGSIGINTLNVVRHFPDKFRVLGLSTNTNIGLLRRQIREFNPRFVCVSDLKAAKKLKNMPGVKTKFFFGESGLLDMVQQQEIESIVLAISGSAALAPLLKAIDSAKHIALANKEALVMAGSIIMRKAKNKKINIIPIDSEQSAIWQCLRSQDRLELRQIYLTASGGPFRNIDQKKLKNISIKEVLKHPRWKMGKKISVDSATLMNKGLELLEAMFLFDTPAEKIKILIHPEALIHSMVEFIDGVVFAQLSATDMRIPIQYALSYPARLSNSLRRIDFYKLRELHFEEPDFNKFPSLRLAYQAARQLGTAPCALNAANEISVQEFLKGRISFISIPKVIEKVLNRHSNQRNPSLHDIQCADTWARNEARKIIERLN